MNSKKGLKTLGVLVSTFTVFFSLTTWAQNYGGDRVGRANGGQYSSRYLPPVLPPGQQPFPTQQQPYPQPNRPLFPNGVNQQNWGAQSYRPFACEEAQMEQHQAQYGLAMAVNNLYNIGEMCKGETWCILGYQNTYNQAVINTQNAQKKIDQACSRFGRPF